MHLCTHVFSCCLVHSIVNTKNRCKERGKKLVRKEEGRKERKERKSKQGKERGREGGEKKEEGRKGGRDRERKERISE